MLQDWVGNSGDATHEPQKQQRRKVVDWWTDLGKTGSSQPLMLSPITVSTL